MLDALQIGASGMQAASAAASVRALNIANVNTKGYLPVEPVTETSDDGVKESLRQPSLSTAQVQAILQLPASAVDLASELMNLRLAEIAYRASASVVKTAGEMAATALDTLG